MTVLLHDEQGTGQVPQGTANFTRGTFGAKAVRS